MGALERMKSLTAIALAFTSIPGMRMSARPTQPAGLAVEKSVER
jgi:hypothetical protein